MTATHGGEPPRSSGTVPEDEVGDGSAADVGAARASPDRPLEQPTQALPLPGSTSPEPAGPGASDSPTGGPSDAPRRLLPPTGPGWAQSDRPVAPPPPIAADSTTVLPGAASPPRTVPPVPPRTAARPAPARPSTRPEQRPAGPRSSAAAPRGRRARLALKRVDPWSVFVFTLVASIFVGLAVVVAAAVLYAMLGALGVTESVNSLFGEVTGANAEQPLITAGRVVGGAAVLGAANVVFLTLLATLSALLYNLCASFTGGIEVTLGERD